jgi:WhiB family redox-sensing transcriptional regulator
MTARQLHRVQPLRASSRAAVPTLGLPLDPAPWMKHGHCAETDPEAFFPELGERSEPAKRICEGCPVINLCREYALDNDIRFGVWGGWSEKQRIAERRRRKQVAA